MHCLQCQAAGTRVVETRSAEAGAAMRRRRECRSCGRRFTTYERSEPTDLFVRKRDGSRERFDRTKLLTSVLKACHKRPVGADQMERLVAHVESAVRASPGEMVSTEIGQLCLEELQQVDGGAFQQFQGVFDPAISAR